MHEKVRNRVRLESIKKDEYKKIIKQQSKLTFNGLHKPYENCDSYTIKKKQSCYEENLFI